MTPGGNLETGAVAIREGNIELPSLVVGANNYYVSFSSPMPDDNYEIYIEAIADFPSSSGSILFIPYHNNEKTANGFTLLVYNNTGGAVAAGLTLYYKVFKLYEVADAEALYSDVTDIKAMIPSNASSSNKLTTANDLRTETRTLDRRLDDVEDVIPTGASISNQLVTESDLSSVEIDKVEDINDVELTSIQDGQTLIWDATNSKWVNGQGGKIYSAGDGINISNTDEISAKVDDTSITTDTNDALKVADTYKTTFVGTTAAWNALSAADKAKYNLVSLTDDAYGSSSVTDTIAMGDMRPVTSNAVALVLYQNGISVRAVHSINASSSTLYLTYINGLGETVTDTKTATGTQSMYATGSWTYTTGFISWSIQITGTGGGTLIASSTSTISGVTKSGSMSLGVANTSYNFDKTLTLS